MPFRLGAGRTKWHLTFFTIYFCQGHWVTGVSFSEFSRLCGVKDACHSLQFWAQFSPFCKGLPEAVGFPSFRLNCFGCACRGFSPTAKPRPSLLFCSLCFGRGCPLTKDNYKGPYSCRHGSLRIITIDSGSHDHGAHRFLSQRGISTSVEG